MKIFANIIPAIKVYYCLRYLNKFKKEILAARRAGDFEKEREYILKATDLWSHKLLEAFNIKVEVEGTENLPTEGPVVYMPNHQGYADIPVCCAALNTMQFGFIAKEELLKVPLYGDWILNIRSVPIRRGDARESLKAINEGIELINNGFSLLVFPEGTRSQGGRQRDMKKGSFKLATKPGVPIIPITISGSHRLFETQGSIKGNQTVKITVHEAIPTAGMSKQEQNELPERVQAIVQSALPDELHYLPAPAETPTLEAPAETSETEA